MLPHLFPTIAFSHSEDNLLYFPQIPRDGGYTFHFLFAYLPSSLVSSGENLFDGLSRFLLSCILSVLWPISLPLPLYLLGWLDSALKRLKYIPEIRCRSWLEGPLGEWEQKVSPQAGSGATWTHRQHFGFFLFFSLFLCPVTALDGGGVRYYVLGGSVVHYQSHYLPS